MQTVLQYVYDCNGVFFQFVPHITMALTVTVRVVSAEEMIRVTM